MRLLQILESHVQVEEKEKTTAHMYARILVFILAQCYSELLRIIDSGVE